MHGSNEVNPFLVTADGSQAKITCARCSHLFNSGPAPLTSEGIEAEVATHQERCFVVGDWVRWEHNGDWLEGELRGLSSKRQVASVKISKARRAMEVGSTMEMLSCNVLRIPRPGQEVASGPLFRCQGYRDGKQCEARSGPPAAFGYLCPEHDAPIDGDHAHFSYPLSIDDPIQQPAPTLYDGLTAEQCYARFRLRMAGSDRVIHDADLPIGKTVAEELIAGRMSLTAAQLAAARTLWSAQLRAKIAASREAERLTVSCEVQDVEDPTW